MRSFLSLSIFISLTFSTSAQWRWYLQAEIGASKQEILAASQLVAQPFDPVSFWRGTAGGEVQFGYTALKVLTAYSGLGYTHQN